MEKKNVDQRFRAEKPQNRQEGPHRKGSQQDSRQYTHVKTLSNLDKAEEKHSKEPRHYNTPDDGNKRFDINNRHSKSGYGEKGYQNQSRAGSKHQSSKYQGKFTKKSYRPKKLGPGLMYAPPAHPEGVRLNRYIANAGICSRRDADKLISEGEISVNGKVVTTLGLRISSSDIVAYKGKQLQGEKLKYILLNKPKGYITTADDPEGRATVMNVIAEACPERVFPVGRLDKNTTGLLLFTNDGILAEKLMHPRNLVKKLYHVKLDKPLSHEHFRLIARGIKLTDGWIKADDISYVGFDNDNTELGIEIHSGKNRIVRRIFEALGYEITKLDRVMFAGLTKKDLRRGKWRFLTGEELNYLKML